MKRIIPFVDTVLMDIKHTDPEKHREFTGRDNALILENARYIAKEARELIIRVPVIPTFNDTKEEIRGIAEFARSIGARKLHLLPYHRIGSDKYAGLGRTYTMAHISVPDRQHMQELLQTVNDAGLCGSIGG